MNKNINPVESGTFFKMSDHVKDFSDVDNNSPLSLIKYLKRVNKHPATANITRKTKEELTLGEGDKIIDFGCGYGKDLKSFLNRVGPNGEVTGIDNSTAMIDYAKKKFGDRPTVKLHVFSAEKVDLPSNYYDVARCERLLQHVPNPVAVIDEMIRVTKDGGMVAISDTDWTSSKIYCPERLRDVTDRILNTKFNCHPGVANELFSLVNPKLKNTKVRGYMIQATSWEFAKVVTLDLRAKRALDLKVITQEEYNDWVETMKDLDRKGQFYHSIDYVSVCGVVKKTQSNL
ncbi:hypothetical protein PPL_03261 [Heterostelium album PN500]|uniref:Methyltransferase domain-containing protein n=1 Tax=Heterostelium pallidum (strain ATCC 26659 / Pp 5 / PN500) TaxID=670386 RepID=D3B4D8_HETP5|nr:hypothetical protein PPL_03261 [Heterostelium album PN500]EFA84186.1 hypothetical protein PPL_03261 [Heterostelium album PN500]|eukprot:XP_020436303.1 hypothetical protein PPL_03261 [Heterostelium album PN500]